MDGIRFVRSGRQWTVHWAAYQRYHGKLSRNFDVVVDEVNTIPFFTPLWADVPAVMFIHQLAREVWWYESPFPINSIGFLAEPWYLKFYRQVPVLTVSQSTKDDLERLRFSGPISIIPEGVEPIAASSNGSKSAEPTFLYVGRLAPSKRIEHILTAFARFRHYMGTGTLRLVGSGSKRYEEELTRLARSRLIEGDVVFRGRASTSEKHALMAESHALLVTSVREGWGLVVSEANACGTPAIVYDVPGLRDSVRNETTGLVVPPNPDRLFDAMVRITSEPELGARLATEGKRWSQTLTFDETARLFGLSLDKALSEKSQFFDEAPSAAELWIRPTRRFAALLGVLFILALAFTEGSSTGDFFANAALLVLLLASVAACAEVVVTRRELGWGRSLAKMKPSGSFRAWLASIAVVAAGSIAAVQTWFRDGTSIAGGDIGPPDGVAWIGRLFIPWFWSGFDLGSPSTLETQLPWAAVAQLVHSAGGSAALAQRAWYTILFAGAAVGALLLLKTLGAGPLPAAIGAAVYVLNPYVVSTVGTSPVFLCALALAVLLPTFVLAAGRSALSVRAAAVLIGISSPLVGYAYSNPPLAGMLLAMLLASPVLAWWLWGGQAAGRAWRAALLGFGLLAVVSAYWIVPAALQIHVSAIGRLSDQASWTWTEARATITNAFWLNNSWAWNSTYYPFADGYSTPPLSFLKYILPATAFASLWALHRRKRDRSDDSTGLTLPLVAVVSVVTLLVLLISTGTRPPGNLLFNPLYSLPLGWLLREPSRFLLLAGLGYSILVAALVTKLSASNLRLRWPTHPLLAALATRVRSMDLQKRVPDPRHVPLVAGLATKLTTINLHARWAYKPRRVPLALTSTLALGAAISVGLGFPMVTGAVVPDSRANLPSMHVSLPDYWVNMAAYVDSAPYQGAVVILPPDDFYQMPYRWGYYGTDGFIPYLMNRAVLVPNNQGYFTSTDLVSAVNLTATSLLDGNWEEADRLLQSLRAPLILVRGDVNSDFPGRTILGPAALSTALNSAPNFILLHKEGPLELFANVQPPPPRIGISPTFATVDSNSPDLRVLSLLPPGTNLISSPPLPGVMRQIEVPPVSAWKIQFGALQTRIDEPIGWRYKIGLLEPTGASQTLKPITEARLRPYVLTETPKSDGSGNTLGISAPATAPPIGDLILVGFPDSQTTTAPELLVLHETYSNDWTGPAGATHVLVDGTINGWLVQSSLDEPSAEYTPTDLISKGLWASAAGVIVLAAIAVTLLPWKRLWIRVRRHV